MAHPFRLTERPIRETGASKQPLVDSLDVSAYDELDAVCVVDGVSGSTTGLNVRIITGMQKQTEDGWVTLVSFTPGNLAAAGAADAVNASTKLLRYIRWEVIGVGGATGIGFDISGMLRRR